MEAGTISPVAWVAAHAQDLLILSTASLFIWLCAVAAHRLLFHPLKSIPGPLVAKLSSVYNTYHIWKKDEARNLHSLHERYGPAVRYGPTHVSIRSPEGVRMLYSNSRFTRKAESYLAFPRNPEKASLFSSIDKKAHARKRRILRYGFGPDALRDAQVTVKKHVATLCRCLYLLDSDEGEGYKVEGDAPAVDGWSTPKNYATWINRYSFDLSSDLSLSTSFDMMRAATNRNIVDIIHDNMWAENVTGSAIKLLHEWKLKSPVLSHWVPSTKPFDDFVDKHSASRVRERMEGSDKDKKDFMFWLTNQVDAEAAGASLEELKEEVILLITAGGDTSSTTISAAMYYLLHNPPKLRRLQDEVRSVFSREEDISFSSGTSRCTYLRACIDEALRMAPPAGSVLRRQVEPTGVTIDDFVYPPGTNIGVPVFSLQHDAEYFPDPFAFQPERWIPGETLADGSLVTEEGVRRAGSAFLPFSAGTRSCIGRPLAYLQMQVLYATLVWKYDFRLCPDRWINGRRSGAGRDTTTEYELTDIFTSWKNGPLIQVKAR